SAVLQVNDLLDGTMTAALAAMSTRSEAVREDFLATTVHEVRQPLAVVKGAAQLALRIAARPIPDLSSLTTELHRIERGANRMAGQVAALSDASRIALGRLDLEPAPVNLAAVVQTAIGHLDEDAAGQ